MPERYKTEPLAVAHRLALALFKVGAMSKQEMQEFDEACLVAPKQMSPKEIRALRKREDVTPTEFANYLCVAPGLVRQWEAGEKCPKGPSLKLLTLVAKNGLDAVA